MPTAEELIALLDLKPLPGEGGFYRETYRSADRLGPHALPGRYTSSKSVSTAIYYLLTPATCSAMHRLPTDEVYHFYLGDPIELLMLEPTGTGRVIELGSDLRSGQQLQWVVPRGAWHGSRLKRGGQVALMGTTVAPAFDFSDYEAGNTEALAAQYPAHAEMIRSLVHHGERGT
jgi:predicted cupin superfamily sugar epimerase